MVIDGDALRLDQVMGNLLSNAVKYTPDGGSIAVESMFGRGSTFRITLPLGSLDSRTR